MNDGELINVGRPGRGMEAKDIVLIVLDDDGFADLGAYGELHHCHHSNRYYFAKNPRTREW